MSDRWLTEMEDAIACRAAGVVLVFNTCDRIFDPASQVSLSLCYALARIFSERGYQAGRFSPSGGFIPTPYGSARSGPDAFASVPQTREAGTLDALAQVLRTQEKVFLLLDYADQLAPQSTGPASLREEQARTLELIHSWGQDDTVRSRGSFLALISYENAVSPLLTQNGRFRLVRVDLPDEDSRLGFVRQLEALRESAQASPIGRLSPDLGATEMARVAAGLRLTDIEELLRKAGSSGTPVTRDAVRLAKQRAIRQLGRDLVEVLEPESGFESVAGAEHAKAFFEEIRHPWAQGRPNVPQAILLAGVPGCGKSMLSKAVARELGVPLLIMRNVREQWVGASERNLETVLWIAENLSPCILWTDEIDQMIGRRGTGQSGDSGTSERLLGRVFEFFGSMDKRSRILWLASTNRPDLLDPALLDRFQIVLPFVHPSRSEREALLPLLARQIGFELDSQETARRVAAHPELDVVTVRSLQEILVMASLRSPGGKRGASLSWADLEPVISDYKPTYDTEQHELIALTALHMTPFRSLLPWTSPGARRGAPWLSYLEGIVDPETGEIHRDRLEERKRALMAYG